MQKAREKALGYLRRTQLKNGGFISLSSPNKNNFTSSLRYQTVFMPAFILSALSQDNSRQSVLVKRKLASWLKNQKSPHGSYNYWAKNAPQRTETPYPDDLDDTFCALSALWLNDSSDIDGSLLAQAVKLLIATEDQPGGPYRTWLVPKTVDKVWLDIDLAVNANVAYFLSLAAEPLPNLTHMMEQAIANKSFHSPYYPDEYPVIYFIARSYRENKQHDLAAYILSLRNQAGHWGTPLHTALAISSLVRLGAKVKFDSSMAYLFSTQSEDGSWPAEAFCIDPAIDGQTYYCGAPALTTAFVLEALLLIESSSHKKQAAVHDQQAEKIYRNVLGAVNKKYRTHGKDMQKNIHKVLRDFTGNNQGKDIVLLPYAFHHSLIQPSKPDYQFLSMLGRANLYGWLAYTIYDDFLDDEGDARMLSGANIAMRESLRCFREAMSGCDDFLEFVDQTFDAIDRANNWEVTYCRFDKHKNKITIDKLPDWKTRQKLAERSFGHALTPIAVLVRHGLDMNNKDVQQTILAIKHYLIARQLNDDLHDWQDDFARGHATYVVTEILKDIDVQQKTVDLKQILPVMQRVFWHETVLDICKVISSHTTKARKALQSCHTINDTNIIITLLDGIDTINAETKKSVANAKGFLKEYGSKK